MKTKDILDALTRSADGDVFNLAQQAHDRIEHLQQLLDDAYTRLGDEHPLDCPRNRDDVECKCGLDDWRYEVEQAL